MINWIKSGFPRGGSTRLNPRIAVPKVKEPLNASSNGVFLHILSPRKIPINEDRAVVNPPT